MTPDAYTACFDPADLRVATATCRSGGVVGGDHPALPRIVAQMATPGVTRILDLGAGREAQQASALRAAGYRVSAIEVGSNWRDGIHDAAAFVKRHDLIYASNVLNVQASHRMLDTTLRVIAERLTPQGTFLANYPDDPRKLGLTAASMATCLLNRFACVDRLPPSQRAGYSGMVFACRAPRLP